MENVSWTVAPVHLITLVEIRARPSGPRSLWAAGELEMHDLAERTSAGYWKLTARGEKWLEMLLATPLPVQRWLDPRTPSGASV